MLYHVLLILNILEIGLRALTTLKWIKAFESQNTQKVNPMFLFELTSMWPEAEDVFENIMKFANYIRYSCKNLIYRGNFMKDHIP